MSDVDAVSSKIKSRSAQARRSDAEEKPWENYPLECHPKQRIFLSIDAIGSTELKSKLVGKGCTLGTWASSFLAFLPEVAIIYWHKFVEVVNNHCPLEQCKNPCVPKIEEIESKRKQTCTHAAVRTWKYIGDEVVLVADLTCRYHQASLHVLALAETLKYFTEDFSKREEQDNRLRFKGTAWVAAFPVTNIEIELPGASEGEPAIRDFLGPSIDLGFRLSKFASEERLIISASLAHLIVNAPPMKSIDYIK